MSSLEVLGFLSLIYMACSGLATHIYLTIAGIQSLRRRLEYGRAGEALAREISMGRQ